MRLALVSVLVVTVACAGRSSTTAPPARPAAAPAASSDEPAGDRDVGLGFVMLAESTWPEADAIVRAHAELAPDGPPLTVDTSDTTKDRGGTHVFQQAGSLVMVSLMPMPIPDGEADFHAEYSVKALADGWKPPPHRAHLMVVSLATAGTALERTRNLHRVIAAAAVAAGTATVGVYIGNGGVTHEPAFYIAMIKEMPDAMLAWSGVSLARDGDRGSVLSRGMGQLGLPDVMLTFGTTAPGDAVAATFDLMLYVARRGTRLAAGDTVGSSASERYPVRYVPSPIDATVEVMQVDYP